MHAREFLFHYINVINVSSLQEKFKPKFFTEEKIVPGVMLFGAFCFVTILF